MKYKILLPMFALISVAVIAAFVAPIRSSVASSVLALPTPVRKPAVKTLSEITYTEGEYDGVGIVKTEAEWKKLLSPNAFYVLRKEGTERAYSGALTDNKKKGTYHCAACGLALFNSASKYASETGWPRGFCRVWKARTRRRIRTFRFLCGRAPSNCRWTTMVFSSRRWWA